MCQVCGASLDPDVPSRPKLDTRDKLLRLGCAPLVAAPLFTTIIGACIALDTPGPLVPLLAISSLLVLVYAAVRARYLAMRPHGLVRPPAKAGQLWLGFAWRLALEVVGMGLMLGLILLLVFVGFVGSIAGGVAP